MPASKKQKTAEKKKGRPTKYQEDILSKLIFFMAQEGKTEKEIADFVGISRATIANWKKEHADFLDTLKKNKDFADSKVEASLYMKACGYSRTAKETIIMKSGPVDIEVTKRFEPDTTAMIFWLKNRQPDSWREKHEHNVTGNLSVNFERDDKGIC